MHYKNEIILFLIWKTLLNVGQSDSEFSEQPMKFLQYYLLLLWLFQHWSHKEVGYTILQKVRLLK